MISKIFSVISEIISLIRGLLFAAFCIFTVYITCIILATHVQRDETPPAVIKPAAASSRQESPASVSGPSTSDKNRAQAVYNQAVYESPFNNPPPHTPAQTKVGVPFALQKTAQGERVRRN